MCFDWREYLNLARCLQCKGWFTYSDEAAYRCAVSRAYYAAFCHARNYARDKQQFSLFHDSRDHKRLRKHFRRRGMNGIATKLDELRQRRNDCDYKDTVPGVSSMTTRAIRKAARIVKQLT